MLPNEMAEQINEGQPNEIISNTQVLPETWMSWNTYAGVPGCPPGQCADYQYLKGPVSEYIQGPSAAAAEWSDQRIDTLEVPAGPWQQADTYTTENQPNIEVLNELIQVREAVAKLETQ